LPFITTWDDSRNQNHPTDSAEEANFEAFLNSPFRARLPAPLERWALVIIAILVAVLIDLVRRAAPHH
jgi:hypothetical protein